MYPVGLLPDLKSTSLPVPELIGGQKLERSLAMPAFSIPPQSPICLAYRLYSYVHFFPRFSIAVLSGRFEPPILGKGRGGRRGLGMVTIRKTVGEFLYRPSIVNVSSIFMRFIDIAAFVLQQATFPYTPPLFSPKFPWE